MLFTIAFLSFLSCTLVPAAPINLKTTATGLILASGLSSAFHVGPVVPGSRGSLKKTSRHTELFEGNDGYGADKGRDDQSQGGGDSEDGSDLPPYELPADFDQVSQRKLNF
jgi:hypothetical protein